MSRLPRIMAACAAAWGLASIARSRASSPPVLSASPQPSAVPTAAPEADDDEGDDAEWDDDEEPQWIEIPDSFAEEVGGARTASIDRFYNKDGSVNWDRVVETIPTEHNKQMQVLAARRRARARERLQVQVPDETVDARTVEPRGVESGVVSTVFVNWLNGCRTGEVQLFTDREPGKPLTTDAERFLALIDAQAGAYGMWGGTRGFRRRSRAARPSS